jgi:hypothetical protein
MTTRKIAAIEIIDPGSTVNDAQSSATTEADMAELYAEISSLVIAIENCRASGNAEWKRKHEDWIADLVFRYMDRRTKLDLNMSLPDKLVFRGSYHHMNDAGYYDGWTDHDVIVRPSLFHGFTLKITGRDRNEIKDYLYDIFDLALRTHLYPEGSAEQADAIDKSEKRLASAFAAACVPFRNVPRSSK